MRQSLTSFSHVYSVDDFRPIRSVSNYRKDLNGGEMTVVARPSIYIGYYHILINERILMNYTSTYSCIAIPSYQIQSLNIALIYNINNNNNQYYI